MIKNFSKFVLRITTGTILGLILIYSVIHNKVFFYFLVLIFQILSIFELKNMFKDYIDVIFWIFITLWLDTFIFLYLRNYQIISNLASLNKEILFPFLICSMILLVIFIIKNILQSTKDTLTKILNSIIFEFFLFFYFIGSLSLSLILLEIKNGFFLLLIFITNYSHDIFAYFFGKTIGKNPFFKDISPSKTLEGYLAGAFSSLIIGSFIANRLGIIELGVYKVFAIVVLIAFLCPFGDLFESLVKRVANVKESGNIILGHGGALDRIDSLVFSIFLSTIIFFAI